MTMPFYVSPEQLMKDRADFARKGIARGRSNIVLQYDGGILFVAENPSGTLHKISEIYDRIAFAAVGRYNEFENLRVAGVRMADLQGYTYDRRDVTGRALANAYAKTLGAIFSGAGEKPYEVEIVVAEVGANGAEDQIYRLTFDGQVGDEHGYVVMGGQADRIAGMLGEEYREGQTMAQNLHLAVSVLSRAVEGDTRDMTADQLEVAALERARPRRAFRRLARDAVNGMLADGPVDGPASDGPGDGGGEPG